MFEVIKSVCRIALEDQDLTVETSKSYRDREKLLVDCCASKGPRDK
jgi:hypothetical protein